jgi:hypothetical protein
VIEVIENAAATARAPPTADPRAEEATTTTVPRLAPAETSVDTDPVMIDTEGDAAMTTTAMTDVVVIDAVSVTATEMLEVADVAAEGHPLTSRMCSLSVADLPPRRRKERNPRPISRM